MSRERMMDVLRALEADGWQLLGLDQYPRGNTDPFALEDDVARWGIFQRSNNRVVDIEFHAFDALGRRTERLEQRRITARRSFAIRRVKCCGICR